MDQEEMNQEENGNPVPILSLDQEEMNQEEFGNPVPIHDPNRAQPSTRIAFPR